MSEEETVTRNPNAPMVASGTGLTWANPAPDDHIVRRAPDRMTNWSTAELERVRDAIDAELSRRATLHGADKAKG